MILKFYLVNSIPLFFVVPIFVIFLKLFKRRSENTRTGTIRQMIKSLKWLVAAISTILPFVVAPILALERTSIFFMTFMFISLCQVTIILTQYLDRLVVVVRPLRYTCLILVLSLFVIFLLKINISGYYLKNEFLARERFVLSQPKYSQITIPSIKCKIPFPLKSYDIESTQGNWVNENVAKFYGMKSIVLDKSK